MIVSLSLATDSPRSAQSRGRLARLAIVRLCIGTAATATLGGSLTGRRRVDDRNLAASDVLTAFTS